MRPDHMQDLFSNTASKQKASGAVIRVSIARRYLTEGLNCGRPLPLPRPLALLMMRAWNRVVCRLWGHWMLPRVPCPVTGGYHEGGCVGCGKAPPR